MNTSTLESKFARMGARARVRDADLGRPSGIELDIRRDGAGEYFDLALDRTVAPPVLVLDVRPRERHLLLMAGRSKFLCGFDERHWFVAAIPEDAATSTVPTAREALKPSEVVAAEQRVRLRRRERDRRRNRAFLRQGEWFFLPEPDLRVDPLRVLRDERLVRGDGKPHIAERCVRQGGEAVYVNGASVLSADEYRQRMRRDQRDRNQRDRNQRDRRSWRAMRRDATVFVRGRIRHPDHKTIVLDVWHRVVMNTETKALAMRHVVFLD